MRTPSFKVYFKRRSLIRCKRQREREKKQTERLSERLNDSNDIWVNRKVKKLHTKSGT